jgi:hypothetical protein
LSKPTYRRCASCRLIRSVRPRRGPRDRPDGRVSPARNTGSGRPPGRPLAA